MPRVHEFGLKIRYAGGDADAHRLELYDGTVSFQGFAQAIQIATHAYLNRELTFRATALRGASFYIKAPRHGSVLLDIVAVIERYPATVAVSAPIFYDFLKYAFSKAGGYLHVEPETPYVSKLSTDDEPFFDDLAELMEGSLQRGHRAIDDQTATQISLERPRSGLVTFNANTSAWVNTREEENIISEFEGNVTRYNSITGNGRIYTDELRRIVPFRLAAEFSDIKRGYLTWSLHQDTTNLPSKLTIQARRIKSSHDEVKRLVLVDVNQAQVRP